MEKPLYRLGDLQLRIMRILWQHGPSTVAEVLTELQPGPSFAYTTIATMLRKMEQKKLVEHDASGRKFVYKALVEAERVTESMSHDLLERLFEGSMSDMVHHLLKTRDVSEDELIVLERMIAEKKKSSE